MKRRIILRDAIWLTPLSVLVITWGWTFLASLIYLKLMRYGWDDLTFPFNQWWIAAPFVLQPQRMTFDTLQAVLDLAISAIVAAALVLMITIVGGRLMWRRWRLAAPRPTLYGTTDWAQSDDLQRNRIRSEKAPF